MQFVIGFDLDMTLIDSSRSIRHCWQKLKDETGIPLDIEAIMGNIGYPAEPTLAQYIPEDEVPPHIERWREIMRTETFDLIEPMPGAFAAIQAVHDRDGYAAIVTAKQQRMAEDVIKVVGFDVDEICAGLFAEGKANLLRHRAALAMVGDHVADAQAAISAKVVPVMIPSGSPRSAFEDLDANIVFLDSLEAFPDWLASFMPEGAPS